jgi:hypothetical protein
VKEVLAYVLGIVGTGMIYVAIAKAVAGNVKYMFARVTMTQLLRTNPPYAVLVCRTKPGTFYEAIGAAIKIAAMMEGVRDPAILSQGTKPGFDAAGTGITMKWKMLVDKCKLAVGMAAGGFALKLSTNGDFPVLLLLLAIAAVGGFIYLYFFKRGIDRSIVLARAEVLPEVDKMFAEGRYVAPPLHI